MANIGQRRPHIACMDCDTKGHVNEVVMINAQEGGKMIRKYHCRLCGGIHDVPPRNGTKASDVSESDKS